MSYLKQFIDISENIKNINLSLRIVSIPPSRICGTCPSDDNVKPSEIKIFNLEIVSPKNVDKLNLLLNEDNFIINDENFQRRNFIKIDKSYFAAINYALHKNPGFDEAFKAMKVVKPTLTEFDFAFSCGCDIDDINTPDKDLVTKGPYHGGDNCVRTDEGPVYTFAKVDKTLYTVNYIKLKIPFADLELNSDIIIRIIQTQQ